MPAAARTTSRVIAMALAWYDELVVANWEPHPITGDVPGVAFLVPHDAATHTGEVVYIVQDPEVGEDGAIEGVAAPGVREERFSLNAQAVVGAGATFPTERELVERLESLSDTIQRTLWDDTETDGRFVYRLIDEQKGQESITQVVFSVAPTDEGVVGLVTVRAVFTCRI